MFISVHSKCHANKNCPHLFQFLHTVSAQYTRQAPSMVKKKGYGWVPIGTCPGHYNQLYFISHANWHKYAVYIAQVPYKVWSTEGTSTLKNWSTQTSGHLAICWWTLSLLWQHIIRTHLNSEWPFTNCGLYCSSTRHLVKISQTTNDCLNHAAIQSIKTSNEQFIMARQAYIWPITWYG